MTVVSDASPLNILVRIGYAELLQALFGKVMIPRAVRDELSVPATPLAVREWLAREPQWLEVRAISSPEANDLPRHRGEREAILLAQELRADVLLLDERRPRRIAASLGIAVVGTLGVLQRGAAQGLINLEASIQKLRQTDFFVSEKLLVEVLRNRTEPDASFGPIAEAPREST